MNLQLDHFPMVKTTTTKTKQTPLPERTYVFSWRTTKTTIKPRRSRERGRAHLSLSLLLEHGFHNVSRWMTWLPISLKNAAKCDKWYQLQNHSITESLNANGAREKPPTAIPVHAVSLSVEQKPKLPKKSLGLLLLLLFLLTGTPQQQRPSGYPESTVKPSIHG